MVHMLSLIIPTAILLPNLLFIGMPPRNLPAKVDDKDRLILKTAEGLGRVGVFVLPLFYSIHNDQPYEILSIVGMFIFLLLYYVGWLRYLRKGRDYLLLFSPMAGIPVPLAVSPILYFLSASIVLHSLFMFLCSLILALGHIPLSLKTYHQITGGL
ncbi:hypothetical protein PWYN_20400 [Paenibacillus wynnii]|uniref:Uncharacterized protein n=1 Tax=Paenibacillus wynnii TaxID=268407 RepID=A0A098M3E2_9BACL|nr:hypothetical protein PWYN_20400 [Paenibacillus wynnii]